MRVPRFSGGFFFTVKVANFLPPFFFGGLKGAQYFCPKINPSGENQLPPNPTQPNSGFNSHHQGGTFPSVLVGWLGFRD